MGQKMRHKCNGIFLCLVLLFVSGCQKQVKLETNNDGSDDGYKPAIRYDGVMYWLSSQPNLEQIPEGYINSQNKVTSCMGGPMQLPEEDFSTTMKNCAQVGFAIYIYPENNENILTVSENGTISLYERDSSL